MTYSVQSTVGGVWWPDFSQVYSADTTNMGLTGLGNGTRVLLSLKWDAERTSMVYAQIIDAGDFVLAEGFVGNQNSGERATVAMAVAMPGGGYAIAWNRTAPHGQAANYLSLAIFDSSGHQIGADIDVKSNTFASLYALTSSADGTISVYWGGMAGNFATNLKDGPTTSGFTATLDEDSAYTFAADDFSFSSATGATLAAVIIDTLPGKGELTLSGAVVESGDRIAVGDIGALVWTPAGDAYGDNHAGLRFRVVDSDGIISGRQRLTFDVDGVDDSPEAAADGAETGENDTAVIDVLENDVDVDGDRLAVTSAAVETGDAEVRIKGDGTLAITYTGHDLSLGETARIKIDYTVSDGALSDHSTLMVRFKGETETSRSIIGTDAADSLTGADRAELIQGRKGDDIINGGGGDDLLRGAAGSDRLAGGAGDNTLVGGKGNDQFVFNAANGSDDTIVDFEPGGDRIELTGFDGITSFTDVEALMQTEGANVVIRLGAAGSITLLSIDRSELHRDDFLI